ncbi:MAG: GNAT family N-acetyltransferase [Caulobacterales bacterium]|nr:GNAT family N-acetyltransferase [Caulobacterales bacterium]MCA0372238.1 GNAT family N-acetyltransferase [Pseudomonadota bacterium]
MTNDNMPKYIIEPLDTSKHNRTNFTCGIPQVDNFFKNTANKLSKADNLRVYVMSSDDGDIVGFYAINAHSIEYTQLPEKFARSRPGHGNIPAAYISMIGRDIRFAKGGFGGDLLVDCLKRIFNVSEQLGIAVVILDVLDCGNPKLVAKRLELYNSYGFMPLPSQPLRLFLPVYTIRKLFG